MPFDETTARVDSLGELRADVRHIQANVTEIKSDLRVVADRFDKTDAKIESVRTELMGRFDKSDVKIETLRTELIGRIDKTDTRLDSLRDALAVAKVWALTLYFALAGALLFVLARGFKWI